MAQIKHINKILFLLLIACIYQPANVFSQTGSELFIENRCARCHTIGRGRFVGPDLYDISKKYNRQQVEAWILNPDIIYSQTNKKPFNPGYPPMPQIGVSEHNAELITNFLFNNSIKKQKENKGVIEGVLVNETTGKGVEGNDIYLKSFIGDRLTDEKLQITDNEGKFSFNDLSWVNSYSVKIKHEGLEYETAKMVFPPDKGTIDLKLPLFETTENDEDIFLNLNHEILSVGEGTVSIAEIYDYENRGNKIFIGKKDDNGQRKTLKFYVPSNSINLKFVEGVNQDNITRDKNIVYDRSGFPPGRKRVVIAYEIPLEYGKNYIEKEILTDVSTLLLLVDDDKGAAEVTTLNELEPVTIENKSYKRWMGEKLLSGSSYRITITNSSLSIEYIDLYPVIIFAALFISVFIIGLISRSEKAVKDSPSGLLAKRDQLINDIVDMDNRYKNNEIEEREYKIQRHKIKSYIADIDKMAVSVKDPRNGAE